MEVTAEKATLLLSIGSPSRKVQVTMPHLEPVVLRVLYRQYNAML